MRLLNVLALTLLIPASATAGLAANEWGRGAPSASTALDEGLDLPPGVFRQGDQLLKDGQYVGCVVGEENSVCLFACLSGNPVTVAFVGIGGIVGDCGLGTSASCSTSGGPCGGTSQNAYTGFVGTGVCYLSPPVPDTVGDGACISGGFEPDNQGVESVDNLFLHHVTASLMAVGSS